MRRRADDELWVPSVILETGVRAVFSTIVVFSLYLLFAGHNRPGGGFVGGLTAGAAFVLVYAAYGPEGLRQVVRAPPEALLGVGLLLAGGTGVAALLVGADFLTSGAVDVDLPLFGHVKLTSALVFDTGVYAIVVGLVRMVLSTLGAEPSR
ncbi:MAG TPA: MnhB domain-containing protein [Egibacteraceae bacterium]